MNKKAIMKMRGFMCQSQDGTASCIRPDCRPSAIVPRRSIDRTLVEHGRLLSNAKYIQLAERRGYVVPARRSSSASSSSSDRHDRVKLDQHALPLSTASQVFQVVVMRVSIHCHGCAGKVKKHLSKMEGTLIGLSVLGYAVWLPTNPSCPLATRNSFFASFLQRVHQPDFSSPSEVNEGVTSFNIDLETKRVTVMGHVSPVAVLESMSKVKKAEFWHC